MKEEKKPTIQKDVVIELIETQNKILNKQGEIQVRIKNNIIFFFWIFIISIFFSLATFMFTIGGLL